MFAYIIRRILGMIPIMLIIVTITFFLMRVAPGGPFDTEKNIPDEVRKNIEATYNLDLPLYQQYFIYVSNILRGDLGPSYKYSDRTVNDIIAASFPVSLKIGALAMLIAFVFGTTLGFLAALKQNTFTDYALMSVAIVGISVPNMVLGPILAVIVGVQLQWLPVAGWGEAKHYVLPVLTLAFYYLAIIARIARGSMLEVIRQDYIQTARSKGLPERVILLRHALRGALLPIVSYCGPASAFIITGSIVIEQIFSVPGVGRYFVQGAIDRDYTLVMGTVLLVSVLVLVFNLIVDVLYGLLDPRIQLHKKAKK